MNHNGFKHFFNKLSERLASAGLLLFSTATWKELAEVLSRSKFAPYLSNTTRLLLLDNLLPLSVFVEVQSPIRACRDPRDDKFLEVAVHGRADAILTGDADLLALHPFQGIDVLSPADFLQRD